MSFRLFLPGQNDHSSQSEWVIHPHIKTWIIQSQWHQTPAEINTAATVELSLTKICPVSRNSETLLTETIWHDFKILSSLCPVRWLAAFKGHIDHWLAPGLQSMLCWWICECSCLLATQEGFMITDLVVRGFEIQCIDWQLYDIIFRVATNYFSINRLVWNVVSVSQSPRWHHQTNDI